MTHDEFVEKVMDAGIFEEASEIRRIGTEGALIPASWMGRILDVVPEAVEYLQRRSPDAWGQYEEAMERRKAAAMLGRKGGSKVTARKSEAARENGKKGGRPRKKQADSK